ncbi:MAG TPA: carbamoyltransferase HypF [Rhizomicrobium sp.]|jgi:hydrogenase maturation protein HypF|nr:carbamoyltransferase HypF [Rhizomicrobium sp.]
MFANTADAAPDAPQSVETVEIRVRGTVQGVGFRPTVWRLARENGLTGQVLNDSAGVLIQITGEPARIARFLHGLKTNPPPLSRIEQLDAKRLSQIVAFEDFVIAGSVAGETRTNVTADAATCQACREEVFNPAERRFRYPFTNCTHCGPRLSIVTRVPYDRASTTMAPFAMCEDCAREYRDPADRRFHAQPIACPACGPKVWLDGDAQALPAVEAVVQALRHGKVVAIRGLGGFHLACDATNVEAVRTLRNRKKRFGKPFALMARDVETIRRYATATEAELELLRSPAAPIVLLTADGPERLPEEVAPRLKTLGFMLPYTPLHMLVVENFDTPLVMTSGNIAHEPQVTGNDEVHAKLGRIADHVLMHDRDIANRIDDSVVRIMAGRPRSIRRARGYAPSPMKLPKGFEDAPEIFAFGGELKSTFCLVKDGQAILSQHQGDLEDAATFDDYQKNMALYRALYNHRPRVFAADMHPEYLSTKLAKEHAQGARLHDVQHHHSHIASCMTENGLAIDAPSVLGVVLDGLGYGADGTIWGGEFLRADYRGFERLAFLKPVAMIGGAQAIREPWRNTYAHLVSAFGWEEFEARFGDLDLCAYLKSKPRASIDRMLETGLNVPVASSCGRLFDAVAAALGLCPDLALFEGQAAIELEDAIEAPEEGYAFDLREPRALWESLLEDIRADVGVSTISARFHYGLASAVADLAVALAPGDTVVLSGGCFQNRTLLEACTQKIERRGLKALSQADIATNDGGLSLGQAAIAAARELAN